MGDRFDRVLDIQGPAMAARCLGAKAEPFPASKHPLQAHPPLPSSSWLCLGVLEPGPDQQHEWVLGSRWRCRFGIGSPG